MYAIGWPHSTQTTSAVERFEYAMDDAETGTAGAGAGAAGAAPLLFPAKLAILADD